MPRSSNYFKAHVVRNDGVPKEEVCRSCRGTGEDRHIADADCMICWGEGTVLLDVPEPTEVLVL